MTKYQELAMRVLNDKEFAKRLVENPEKVLRENGVEPNQEMLEALAEVDVQTIEKLAEAFSDGGKAM